MKLFLQAVLGSLAIHIVYFISLMIIGYIKTRNYKPDVAEGWNNVEHLQSVVAFSSVGSPVVYLLTFFGTSSILGLIIFLTKELSSVR